MKIQGPIAIAGAGLVEYEAPTNGQIKFVAVTIVNTSQFQGSFKIGAKEYIIPFNAYMTVDCVNTKALNITWATLGAGTQKSSAVSFVWYEEVDEPQYKPALDGAPWHGLYALN